MSRIVLVADASSDLGAATARALADAGHTVYAGIAPAAARSAEHKGHPQLRAIALDLADQRSVSVAVEEILTETGRIDAVVHATGPVPRGPVESFTPYQLAQIYDAHVLSTQRVNRSVLPQMRERRDGLLVWVVPRQHDTAAYLALHIEAITMIDHLVAGYARELAGFGIETTIVSPGTNPWLRTVFPDDTATVQAYEDRYPGLVDHVDATLAAPAFTDADLASTAESIAAVVSSPKGSRPRRITGGVTPPSPRVRHEVPPWT